MVIFCLHLSESLQALGIHALWRHLLHSWLAYSKPGQTNEAWSGQANSAIDGAQGMYTWRLRLEFKNWALIYGSSSNGQWLIFHHFETKYFTSYKILHVYGLQTRASKAGQPDCTIAKDRRHGKRNISAVQRLKHFCFICNLNLEISFNMWK